MEYEKPFKTLEEQVQLLKDRGLIVDDNAVHYLRHLNYYRLASYWLPFEKDHKNHLIENIHFKDILNLYIFDRELRLLLLDAIERIEVSIRTRWAYFCAQKYGSHAYCQNQISKNQYWHSKNLFALEKEIKRSTELFIKHYQTTYITPENPPIWVVCEVMSLGLLSRWLKDLKPTSICHKLGDEYKVDYSVLSSFIEHLAYLRNLCAHHSRVWNRKFIKTMKLPRSKPSYLINEFNQESIGSRKLYNSLVMIIHFLDIISPNHHFKSRLLSLIDSHRINTNEMGFPKNWQNLIYNN